jgi:type IV pilus assembly protein PilQ
MRQFIHSVRRILTCIAFAATSLAFAQAPADLVISNSIDDLQVTQQGGDVIVKVTMHQPLQSVPASFSVTAPARIAFDFPSAESHLGRPVLQVNQGDLRSVNVVQVADRTRIVFNLSRTLPYDTRIEGASLFITLSGQAAAKETASTATAAKFTAKSEEVVARGIRDISFRRGEAGEGRVIVDLTDPNVAVDMRKQGQNLVVDFAKATLPETLLRRMNVTDFATPITLINTTLEGQTPRIVITPRGLWEHTAYQIDNQFIIEVKPVVVDPTKISQGSAGGYQGEKITLEFQHADVRDILNIIGYASKLDFVVSDKIAGTMNLSLHDAPWDQALNVVMERNNLSMHKDGNVLVVEPIGEFTAREEQKAKAQAAVQETMHQEAFQINYHKAKTVGDLIRGILTGAVVGAAAPGAAPAAAAGGPGKGFLLVDDRSNKIFVTDTAAKLDKVREMIQAIDVPVRQVMIEARIVEAADTFNRELGVRLGLMDTKGQVNGYNLTGNGSNGYRFGFGGSGSNPGIDTTATVNNLVNLPVGAATGTINLSLFNSAKTQLLSVELSAAESDNRTKTISNPRVLTTDKQAATIESGTQIPYVSCTQTTGCTTAFIPAKLNLTVTPQITPDGRVVMTLDIHKDSQGPLTAQGQPIINTEQVKTEVLVENGGTVVIGGIFTQDSTDGVDRIPFLGDLPYVGFLFKHTTKIEKKQELLIFITPRIVADELTLR